MSTKMFQPGSSAVYKLCTQRTGSKFSTSSEPALELAKCKREKREDKRRRTIKYVPSKEDHLHVPSGEHFPNTCHFDKVTPDLQDLVFCGDWIQLFIFVRILHVEVIRQKLVIPIILGISTRNFEVG